MSTSHSKNNLVLGAHNRSPHIPHHIIGFYIETKDGGRVAEVFVNCGANEKQARATAEKFVLAANAYEALVSALAEAINVIDRIQPECNGLGAVVHGIRALKKAGVE